MPDDELFGDAVVLSFGRGKPLSLMEGGCLLAGERVLPSILEVVRDFAAWDATASGTLRRYLHDVALSPELFSLARKIPGLNIGKVQYRHAPVPRRAGRHLADLATRAANAYQSEIDWRERQHVTDTFIRTRFPALRPIGRETGGHGRRLNRLPYIAPDSASAADAHRRAMQSGIGATRMYGRAQTDIEGIPSGINGRCRNARSLAERLVTFPILRPIDVERLRRRLDI